MNTYTHFLWAVCLSRWILLRRKQGKEGCRSVPTFDQTGALLGSVLPDLPLIATTIVCFIHDYFFVHDDYDGDQDDGLYFYYWWTNQLFDIWYFKNPWMISAHNLFHSPVSVGFLLLIVYLWHNLRYCCAGCSCSRWCSTRFYYWILASAMFHALCDIPVHHNDGPLIFWPLNWSYRYWSPVSYWDPKHYGTPVSIAEHTLDVIIVVWLLYAYCRRRRWWCHRSAISKMTTTTTNHEDDEEEVMMVANPMNSTNATNHETEVMMLAKRKDGSKYADGDQENGTIV